MRTGIDSQKLSLFPGMKISFLPVQYHYHVDARQSVYESLSVYVVCVYVCLCVTQHPCVSLQVGIAMKKTDNKQCLLHTPRKVMVNKENYQEYKGHTKWLSDKQSLCQKYFFLA